MNALWDRYQFSALNPGRQPVDDFFLVILSVTALGAVVGGCIGATLGVLVSLMKWQAHGPTDR